METLFSKSRSCSKLKKISFLPAGLKRIITSNAGDPSELLPAPKKQDDLEAMWRRCCFVYITDALFLGNASNSQPLPAIPRTHTHPQPPLSADPQAVARAELQKWWDLHNQGAISRDEYENLKRCIFGNLGL